MSLVHIENGPFLPAAFIPNPRLVWSGTLSGLTFSAKTVDATAEKIAMLGHIAWEGNPTAAKTMGATSKIHFRTGTTTFADAGTNLRIGIQDSLTTGTQLLPDGTFDVYADVAGNGGLITSSDDNVVKSITLSTSGTKDIAHGDLIAVVFDMTARAGFDSVQITALDGGTYFSKPSMIGYAAAAWDGPSAMEAPMCILEASDGTLGMLRGAGPLVSAVADYTFQASTNPDEHGLIFRFPFRCKICSVAFVLASNSANADAVVHLYSDPLGTPTEMMSLSLPGENSNAGTDQRPSQVQLASEYTLEANTDYCMSIEATGTVTVDLGYATINAAHRKVAGMDNMRHGYRNNLTGAFTEVTTEIPFIAIGISQLDDGSGQGASQLCIGI